jgi:uncharacterized protein (DUF433 family)
MMSADASIGEYIELNPHYPGLDEARLKRYGVAVWALIAYLPAVGGDLTRVAAGYDVPQAAVEAAYAYYQRHQALIDARIAENTIEADPLLSAA